MIKVHVIEKENLDTEQPITKTTQSPTEHPLEDENWTIINIGLHTITFVIISVRVFHTDDGQLEQKGSNSN